MFNLPFTCNLSPKHVLHLALWCKISIVSDLAHVGESKARIASCNILAVNSDPLEDFPSRFLFFHEVNQL